MDSVCDFSSSVSGVVSDFGSGNDLGPGFEGGPFRSVVLLGQAGSVFGLSVLGIDSQEDDEAKETPEIAAVKLMHVGFSKVFGMKKQLSSERSSKNTRETTHEQIPLLTREDLVIANFAVIVSER